MRAHLTNCVHIWSLSVGLTKCAAHLGKRAARLAKRARDLPNVAKLVKCRAFDQLVKCALHIASLQIIATCSVLVSSRLYKKDIPVLRLINVTNIAGSEPGVSWCPDIPRFDQGVSRDNPSFNKLSVIFIEPLLICEWLIVDFVPPKA